MHNPSEIVEPAEVLLVQNRPLPLAKVNPPKSVTVTEQAKDEQWTGENKVEPVWNFDLNGSHNILSFFATEQAFLATEATEFTENFF